MNLRGISPEPSRVISTEGFASAWTDPGPPPPLLAVPVRDSGQAIGWIAMEDGEDLAPAEQAAMRSALLAVADAAAIPTLNAQRYRQALEAAMRDPLTGLFNRRALDVLVAREVEAVRRNWAPLSLLLVDLDNFKDVNDAHGHAAGDQVLEALGALLSSSVRATDVVARLGGDEFVALLPDTDALAGARLGGRIRRAITELDPELPGRERTVLSASIGLAELADAGGNAELWFEITDAALYQAKRHGGNQVRRAAAVACSVAESGAARRARGEAG